MKRPNVRAVDMVRRIRDRQQRALTGKSAAEVIAYYRAEGTAATQAAASPKPSANKSLQPTSRADRGGPRRPRRAARG